MHAGRRPSSAPDSWRKAKTSGKTSGASTLTARRCWAIFFTVLLLAALCILIWYLIPKRPSQTFLAVCAMRYSSHGTDTPDNTFWESDENPFKKVGGHIKYDFWSDLDIASAHGGDGGGVADRLARTGAKQRDTFSLYLQTDGIAADDSVYLFYEGFKPGTKSWDDNGKVFMLRGLLKEFEACPAKAKLLLLDAGRIDYDPRLGVLDNGLPRAVERVVREFEDPQVWVLMSHSDHQRTGGLLSQYPSVFARAVAEAFGGQADKKPCGDEDGQVTLKEFYYYVWNRTSAFFDKASGYAQTPMLMRSGYGAYWPDEPRDNEGKLEQIEKDLDALVLVRLPITDEASAEEDKKDQESAPEAKEPNGEGDSDGGKPGAEREDKTPPAKAKKANPDETAKPDGEGTGAKESTESSKPAGDEGNDEPSASKSDEPASSDRHDSDEAAGGGDGPVETPASTEDTTEATWLTSLGKMWSVRDRLEDPKTDLFGPIDFAPHIWRTLNDKLLGEELHLRRRSATQPVGESAIESEHLDKFAKDLNLLYECLQDPDRYLGDPARNPRFESNLRTDFVEIVEQAERCQYAKRWKDAFQDDKKDISLAIRQYNRATFLIPDYLRWHAKSRRPIKYELGEHEERGKTLHEFLRMLETLQSELQRWDGEELTVHGQKNLEKRVNDLVNAEDDLGRQLAADVRKAVKERGSLAECLASDLLSSPLLRSVARVELAAMPTAKAGSVGSLRGFEKPRKQEPDVRHWVCLEELMDLEIQSIGLFDERTSRKLGSQHASCATRRRTWGSTGGDPEARLKIVDDLWQLYDILGIAMSSFYAQLAVDVNAGEKRPTDAKDQPEEERTQIPAILRLVDSRDRLLNENVPNLLEDYSEITPPPPIPVLRFAEDEPIVELSNKQPSEQLSIGFIAQNVEGELVVDVDDETVARFLDVKWKHLAPTDADDSTHTIELDISLKPTRDREDDPPIQKLTIRVTADSLPPAEHAVYCKLPRRNQIDLSIARIARNGEQIPIPQRSLKESGDVLELRSYPERDTEFKCWLSNRSGEPRNVRVQLARVPEIKGGHWPPGRLIYQRGVREEVLESVLGEDGGFRDGTRIIASGKMTLPATDDPTPLSFGADIEGEGTDEPAKPDEPTPEPFPEDGLNVTHGLVLLITDVDNPKDRWIKWLELSLKHPKAYLDAGPPVYADGEIQIPVRPKDELKDMPPFSAEAPIRVWRSRDVKRNLNIDREGWSQLLVGSESKENEDDGSEFVELDVDGYPRAFIFEVETRQSGRAVNWTERGTREFVQFQKIQANYEDAEPIVKSVRDLSSIAIKPCKSLDIHFAADVPDITFVRDYEPGDGIRMTRDRKLIGEVFYADRAIKTSLVAPVDESGFKLHAKVTDHRMPIPDFPAEEMKLEAKLPKNCSSSDAITVYLDDVPPTVEFTEPLKEEVPQGEEIEAKITVYDKGGISRIEWAMGEDPPKEFEAEHVQEFPDSERRQRDLDITADATELKVGSKYRLVVRAVDRAGNAFDLSSEPVQVVEAPPIDSDMQKGVIKGEAVRVLGNEKPISGANWRLTIAGPGMPETTLRHGDDTRFSNGKFLFKDLEPGEYHLKVFTASPIDGYHFKGSESAEPKPPHEPGIVIKAK